MIFFLFARKGLVVLVFNDNIIRICFICIFFGKWVFWDRVVYTQLGRSLIVPINIKKKGGETGFYKPKPFGTSEIFHFSKVRLRYEFNSVNVGKFYRYEAVKISVIFGL